MSIIRLTPPTYLILFVTSACCIAYGHESSADETEAVAARVQAYVTAFNQRDLDACAEHWSETAEYVLPASGARVSGAAKRSARRCRSCWARRSRSS